MSKSHRGKGLREIPSRSRGECPVCKRNVKLLYEQDAGEGKKVKICKICKAALKHGKKSLSPAS